MANRLETINVVFLKSWEVNFMIFLNNEAYISRIKSIFFTKWRLYANTVLFTPPKLKNFPCTKDKKQTNKQKNPKQW